MQICLHRPVRSALLLLAALAALLLASCGGDDSGDAGADPATVTPADALLYVEAAVRPEGDQRDDLLSALGKLLGDEDPGARIRELAEQAASEEGYSYGEDIEPWLGGRAALFLTDVSDQDGEGAGVVAVTDRDAAEETVRRAIDEGGESTEEASYEGTDYTIVGDGAVGFVGDFLVGGTEDGFKAAVDASAGEALSGNGEATAALDTLTGDPVLEAYVDGDRLIDALVEAGVIDERDLESAGAAGIDQLRAAPVAFGLGASSDSLFVDLSAAAGDGDQPASVAGLPDQSWLALAVPMIGEAVSSGYESFLQGFEQGFRESFGGPAGLEGIPDPSAGFAPPIPDIRGAIEDATGLDLSKDLEWAGTMSVFAQGTSIFNLGGGVVIETDDEAAAADAVEKLGKALQRGGSVQVTPTPDGFTIAIPGAPVPAEVAVRDGRVVLAVAGVDVDSILDPAGTLADSEAFAAAGEQLGSDLEPALFIDVPTILQLVESSGQATGDPSYEQARPYLSAMRFMVAGSGTVGDRSLARFVLGVQDGSSSTAGSASGAAEPEAAALLP